MTPRFIKRVSTPYSHWEHSVDGADLFTPTMLEEAAAPVRATNSNFALTMMVRDLTLAVMHLHNRLTRLEKMVDG